jgi:hypothetical protein
MTWHQKALIGAIGGVALVLLKLIEVQFFLDDMGSKKAFAAYLTYAAYVALGIIVAVFFTDESLDEHKRKKSAFIAGLLAPAFLLAVVRQPMPGHGPEAFRQDPAFIPKIGLLFVRPAHAQTPSGAPKEAAVTTPIPVVELKREQVEASFADGIRLAIGRPELLRNYIYVLGQADSREKALSAAKDVNQLLLLQARLPGAAAYVIRPEGTDKWFVTVGQVSSAPVALQTRAAAQSAAVGALTAGAPTQVDKTAAKLILDGRVVSGSALFQK